MIVALSKITRSAVENNLLANLLARYGTKVIPSLTFLLYLSAATFSTMYSIESLFSPFAPQFCKTRCILLSNLDNTFNLFWAFLEEDDFVSATRNDIEFSVNGVPSINYSFKNNILSSAINLKPGANIIKVKGINEYGSDSNYVGHLSNRPYFDFYSPRSHYL